LGITFTTTQNLVDQLRNVPPARLIEAQSGWMSLPVPRGVATSFDWVPSVEPAGVPDVRFLTDTPTNLMRTGNFIRVPIMIGYTSDESLFMIRESLLDNTTLDTFPLNPFHYVPRSFNLNPATQPALVNEVATSFRNTYFNGGHPSEETRYNYTQFISDSHFAFPVDRVVRYHAMHQTHPIYYYKFTMDGSLNMLKTFLFLGDYPGAMHADDIFHLWQITSFPIPILPGNAALELRRRMVRMWVSFATNG